MSNYEAIILCGGKGTRVSRFTKHIPKCLIDINGKPFLYHQLKFLKQNDIKKVIISTGYLSKNIKNYLKKNINFINFKVQDDGKKLLGTGGAILKSINLLKKNFFVIYGDSYLRFKLKNLKIDKKISTMAIFKNNNKYDKSNVELKRSSYIVYHEKKNKKKFNYIDYGTSYLNKNIFKNYKKNVKFDLSSLFQDISKKNMLKGYKVKKRFYEIGSYAGINELTKFIKK